MLCRAMALPRRVSRASHVHPIQALPHWANILWVDGRSSHHLDAVKRHKWCALARRLASLRSLVIAVPHFTLQGARFGAWSRADPAKAQKPRTPLHPTPRVSTKDTDLPIPTSVGRSSERNSRRHRPTFVRFSLNSGRRIPSDLNPHLLNFGQSWPNFEPTLAGDGRSCPQLGPSKLNSTHTSTGPISAKFSLVSSKVGLHRPTFGRHRA